MKALTKNLEFAVAALIVVALGFYFIEVYAPSRANPTLSAAIRQDSIPIGSMLREFLEYVPQDISPHSPLVIVLHGALMDAKSMREWTGYEFDQLADQHGFVVVQWWSNGASVGVASPGASRRNSHSWRQLAGSRRFLSPCSDTRASWARLRLPSIFRRLMRDRRAS